MTLSRRIEILEEWIDHLQPGPAMSDEEIRRLAEGTGIDGDRFLKLFLEAIPERVVNGTTISRLQDLFMREMQPYQWRPSECTAGDS